MRIRQRHNLRRRFTNRMPLGEHMLDTKKMIQIIAIFLIVLTTVHFAYGLTHQGLIDTINVSSLITWSQRPTTINLEYISYNFDVQTIRPHSQNQSLGYEISSMPFTGRVVTTQAYNCLNQFTFQQCYTLLIMTPNTFRYRGETITPVLYQWNQFYWTEYRRLEQYQHDSEQYILLQSYEDMLRPFTEVTFGG